MNRIPSQHRAQARTLAHRLALERGQTVITSALLEEAMGPLAPGREERQLIGSVAQAVALEALRREGGTTYLCRRCGHVARQSRPDLCPVCKAPGEEFFAVSQADLGQAL